MCLIIDPRSAISYHSILFISTAKVVANYAGFSLRLKSSKYAYFIVEYF